MDIEATKATEACLKESNNVLFAGCGIGWDVMAHIEHLDDARVTAIDPNPQLIEFARIRFGGANEGNVRFAATSMDRFNAKDIAFDAVFIGQGEHPSMNRRSVYTSAYELMCPGGTMTSSDLVLHDAPPRLRAHEYPYEFGVDALLKGSEIEELLLSVGYQSVSITEVNDKIATPLTKVNIQAVK